MEAFAFSSAVPKCSCNYSGGIWKSAPIIHGHPKYFALAIAISKMFLLRTDKTSLCHRSAEKTKIPVPGPIRVQTAARRPSDPRGDKSAILEHSPVSKCDLTAIATPADTPFLAVSFA